MSVKRTTGASAAKRKAPVRKRSGIGTDWERLRKMTDAQAARGATGDRDNPPSAAAWLAAGQLVEPVANRPSRCGSTPKWWSGSGVRARAINRE